MSGLFEKVNMLMYDNEAIIHDNEVSWDPSK